jgi:hypothetical protein
MYTREPVSKHTAFQEGAELALDEAGHTSLPIALPCEKRFQMSFHNSIEWVFFLIARPVHGVDGHEGMM